MRSVYFFLGLVSWGIIAPTIEITAPRARAALKKELVVYEQPTIVYHKTTTITAHELEARFEKQALKTADMHKNIKLVDEEGKTITCDEAHYDHGTEKLELSGSVVITYKDDKKAQTVFAQADIVVYDCATQEVILTGNTEKPVTTIITTPS